MPEPTPVTSRLGAELKALRTKAGLSQRQIASGWYDPDEPNSVRQAKVHRIETGKAIPTSFEFQQWLRFTDATDEDRARVEELLEAAHNPSRPWRGLIGADGQLQTRAADREHASKETLNLSLNWIPGLLQTPEYAKYLLAEVSPPGADIAAQVAGRIDRQRILFEDGRTWEFIIGEQALLWEPGPGVMPAQFDRLEQLNTLQAVLIKVLPIRRSGAPAWHDFILRTPLEADGELAVDGELMHAEFATTDLEALPRYYEVFQRLWKVSEPLATALQRLR